MTAKHLFVVESKDGIIGQACRTHANAQIICTMFNDNTPEYEWRVIEYVGKE